MKSVIAIFYLETVVPCDLQSEPTGGGISSRCQGQPKDFRRLLNDLEIDNLTDFYYSLEQANNLNTNEDSLQWLRAKMENSQ